MKDETRSAEACVPACPESGSCLPPLRGGIKGGVELHLALAFLHKLLYI